MTVESATSKVSYSTTNGLLTYAYPFKIYADGDLRVYLETTLQTLTTQYTVSGAGDVSGGNVVLVTNPGTGKLLVIERVLPILQGHDYVENDKFPAESHEAALDYRTLVEQMLYERDRKRPALLPGSATVDRNFPDPVSYAPNGLPLYVRWNAAHTDLEAVTQASDVVGVLDDTVASVAYGSLPAVGTPGRLRRVTDYVRGLWIDVQYVWASLPRRRVSVADLGAIGDGTSHPLSERYGSLAAAQAVYPHATALSDEIDWAAIQGALNVSPLMSYGRAVDLEADRCYVCNQPVSVPAHTTLQGQGRSSVIRYTGAGIGLSVNPGSGVVTTMRSQLKEFTLRSAVGTIGLQIKDASFVDVQGVNIFGNNTDGAARTGWSTAGVDLTATVGQACIMLRFRDVAVQTCVGDGWRNSAVNNINQVSMVGCSAQGNGLIGLHVGAIGRAWYVAGGEYEGNGGYNVQINACFGLEFTGNYLESSGINIAGTAEVRGLVIQGNHLGGPGSGTGITVGTVGSGFLTRHVKITGNWISGFTNAYSLLNCSGVEISDNDETGCTNPFANTFNVATGITYRTGGASGVPNLLGNFGNGGSITNSAAASASLMTIVIPAHTLRPHGKVWLHYEGSYTNNSAGVANFTIRVQLAGSTVAVLTMLAVVQDVSPHLWTLDVYLSQESGASDVQYISAHLTFSPPLAALGTVTSAFPATVLLCKDRRAGILSQEVLSQVDVTLQHSVADANITGSVQLGYGLRLPY